IFLLNVEKEQFAVKHMNCPGHCLIFDSHDRSYKELPICMAEFGVLHKNEASGAQTGLTRVKRSVQDNMHIFCTPQQIREKITGLFDFLQHVYGILGLMWRSNLFLLRSCVLLITDFCDGLYVFFE
ncbi:class II aaRS and biotin synthetase, partial [Ramaria rubella]